MKPISLVIVCCLGLSAVFAQPATSNNALLYKISVKGFKNTSYIFGTFHIMCPEDFTVGPELTAALQTTQQFYGELDMSDPNLQMAMMNGMTTEKTLQSHYGDSLFAILNQQYQKITGLPLMTLNTFQPFMSMSLLIINTPACKAKVQPETELLKVAKANNHTIYGLETVEDQIKALQYQPLEEQYKALQQSIENYDSVKTVFQQMTKVYNEKNIDSLINFMKTLETDQSFETEMLTKRNQKWIPIMIKALAQKPTFFAVGAGHLGGENGVLALLRAQGFTVTPVIY
jgi:uncharacterized protein YbaP (TraB family)